MGKRGPKGPRTKYSIEKLAEFAALRHTTKQIADYYGVATRTVTRWKTLDPEVRKLFPNRNHIDRDENGHFKKGTIPNPEGRTPKKRQVEVAFQSFLATREKVEGEQAEVIRELPTAIRMGRKVVTIERLSLLVYSLYQRALTRGDMTAMRILLEYAFGKPVAKFEHTGEDGGAIKFDITEKREEAQRTLMRRIERIKERPCNCPECVKARTEE